MSESAAVDKAFFKLYNSAYQLVDEHCCDTNVWGVDIDEQAVLLP
jgi:hypothetical protein